MPQLAQVQIAFFARSSARAALETYLNSTVGQDADFARVDVGIVRVSDPGTVVAYGCMVTLTPVQATRWQARPAVLDPPAVLTVVAYRWQDYAPDANRTIEEIVRYIRRNPDMLTRFPPQLRQQLRRRWRRLRDPALFTARDFWLGETVNDVRAFLEARDLQPVDLS